MTPEFHHHGFTKHIYVNGRRSIADEFAKTRRCGIYILHFSNGEYYVGQAVNVANRFVQHRVKHTDIEYISFKCVGKRQLSQVEKDVIRHMEEQKKVLRNISLVSIVKGESDLDDIVSPEDQERWMNDELPWETLETERFEYPEQRKKYTDKFNKLKTHEYYYFVLSAPPFFATLKSIIFGAFFCFIGSGYIDVLTVADNLMMHAACSHCSRFAIAQLFP